MADRTESASISSSSAAGDMHLFNVSKIESGISSNVASYRKAQSGWEKAQHDPAFTTYNTAFQKMREETMATPGQAQELAVRFHQFCKDHSCEHIMKAQQAILEETTLKLKVEETQKLLNKLGYDCGDADGIMGRKTITAIQAYEKDRHVAMESYKGKGSDGIERFYVSEETSYSLAAEAEHMNRYGSKRGVSQRETVTLSPRGGDTVADTLEEMAGGLGIPKEQQAKFIEAMKNAGISEERLTVRVDLDQFNISPGQMRLMSQVRDDYEITQR